MPEARIKELETELKLFKAKEQCLPPGYAIADDASAEFALRIVELEAGYEKVRKYAHDCEADLKELEQERARLVTALRDIMHVVEKFGIFTDYKDICDEAGTAIRQARSVLAEIEEKK